MMSGFALVCASHFASPFYFRLPRKEEEDQEEDLKTDDAHIVPGDQNAPFNCTNTPFIVDDQVTSDDLDTLLADWARQCCYTRCCDGTVIFKTPGVYNLYTTVSHTVCIKQED